MSSGLLVYFDGPDGVGKTTQLELAAKTLRDQGHAVYATHVLGGSPISNALREVMMSGMERPPETSLYMSLASQYASAKDILKRRHQGDIILIDRSPLSMYAYQVYGDKLDVDKGEAATQDLLDLYKPDLIIVYEAPEGVLLSRRREQQKHKPSDHFERMPNDYHHQVITGYKEAVTKFSAEVIDATADEQHVHASTMKLLLSALDKPA